MGAEPLSGSSMSPNRIRSIVLYTATGIVLLFALVGLLFAVEQKRAQVETSAVLSAVFSSGVLRDADKRGSGRTIEIVIQRDPHCFMCSVEGEIDDFSWFGQSLKSRVSSLTHTWFAQSSPITRFSFFMNSVFSTDIRADLALPNGARAVFIYPSDLQTKTGESQPRFPEFFVVSHVGLNLGKTEALLYVDHFCGGLCGSGDYFLMRKANGVWRIVDRLNAWVT
ncbi:MAG TPA: hypothetical protein VMP12_09050 [Candidatus Sulfotelmatobacter sp.]|nr:hypothetical protein [Candidatus Sulfotelmatobacter sp.]